MNETGCDSEYNGLEVAVIGMAGRFPGAGSVRELWENIKNGVEGIRFFSDPELIEDGVEPTLLKNPNYVKAFGFFEGGEQFDAPFFGFSHNEARTLDPQSRVFLELSWSALEDAGYDPLSSPGAVGVYAGAASSFYWEAFRMLSGEGGLDHFSASNLMSKDFLPALVSYRLNLKGPAFSLNTACSTSLAAVALACQGLLSAECDYALAGGVTLSNFKKQGYLYEEGMIHSPDGHCRVFDAGAAGTVGGNGAAVVVLKLLDRALEDRDHIYAVIKAIAANNDGTRKVGFSAPSVDGQAEVIKAALEAAEVSPESIGYVEAHGTATPLGDPVEVEALKIAFDTTKRQYCGIGSVKSNLGHLDCAAGVTGLIKAVLALKHRKIPPSLHVREPNPKMDFGNSPFYVCTELREWPAGDFPRRAGVSSFGIGGTNVHAVLEEAPEPEPSGPGRPDCLFLLSAHTPAALDRGRESLARYLHAHPGTDPRDAAYTLQAGRTAFVRRGMLVCSSPGEAVEALTGTVPGRYETGVAPTAKPGVVFMFSGQGSQYTGMGHGLYLSEPLFRERMDRCFRVLEPLLEENPREVLYPSVESGVDRAASILGRMSYSGPLKFAFEYALAGLLMEWGIVPYAMIGHSFGEYTAAVLSGVLSLEDVLMLAVRRGRLMDLTPEGVMMSVPLPEAELVPLLPEDVALAAVNTPSLCIVSGPPGAVDHLEAELGRKGCECLRLRVPRASHSPMMETAAGDFSRYLQEVAFNSPQIPYISGLTGNFISPDEAADPGYYTAHLCRTVRFSDGLGRLMKKKNTLFLEISPGRGLSSFVEQHPLKRDGHRAFSMVRHHRDEISDNRHFFLQLGRLWLAGVRPQWPALYAHEKRNRIPLPGYSFEPIFYPGTGDLGDAIGRLAPGAVSMRRSTDMADWFYVPSWERSAPIAAAAGGKSTVAGASGGATRCLVFAHDDAHDDAHGFCGDVVRALEERGAGATVTVVRPGPGFSLGPDGDFRIDPSRPEHYRRLFSELERAGRLPGQLLHLWNTGGAPADGEYIRPENLSGVKNNTFYSFLYIVRALGKLEISDPLEILAVCDGLFEVNGGEMLVPHKALLLGPLNVIPIEYPHMTGRCIDVVIPGDPGGRRRLAEQLAWECRAPDPGTAVAYRGKHRWLRTLKPLRPAPPADDALPLREDGVYLVTGGTRGIGLALAHTVTRRVRARMVLIARTPFPPRDRWDTLLSAGDAPRWQAEAIAVIKEMEDAGGTVFIESVDIADKDALKGLVDSIEERFGAVNGVIHSAGVPGGAFIQGCDRTGTDPVLRPKLEGTLVLDALFRGRGLDFMVLCSSLNAFQAAPGQAAYSAANAFLDAYAHSRTAAGERVLSVNWDRWRAVGMAAAVETAHKERTGEELDGGFSRDQGCEIFNWLLGLPIAQAAVSPVPLQDMPRRAGGEPKEETSTPEPGARDGAPVEEPGRTLYPRPYLNTPCIPPANDTEEGLARIWQQFFQLLEVGVEDDFFQLGGDSLKALTLSNQVYKTLKVKLPVSLFFNRPTIRQLAGYIGEKTGAAGYRSIEPVKKQDHYPLSPAQGGIYAHQQLDTGSVVYNVTSLFPLPGDIEPRRLELAFSRLIQRHESLRTSFRLVNGKPVQVVHEDVDFELCREEPPGGDTGVLIRPFDLGRAPLLRVFLLTGEGGGPLLLMDMHHIVTDGLSMNILMRDLTALYHDKPLAPLPLQYRDFACWCRERRDGILERRGAFWRDTFSGGVPRLHLPLDFPRPPVQRFEGACVPFDVDGVGTGGLKQLASRADATLFMVLAAVFYVFLGKWARQEDLVVGTPVSGRGHPDLEQLVGMFVNTVPLRARPAADKSFMEVLAEVKTHTLAAFENQDYPMEQLLEDLELERAPGRHPLFDVTFVLQGSGTPGPGPEGPDEAGAGTGGDSSSEAAGNRVSRFDLSLEAYERGAGISGFFIYCTALFAEETIRLAGRRLSLLITRIVENPDAPLGSIDYREVSGPPKAPAGEDIQFDF